MWTNNISAPKNSGDILSRISDNYPIFVKQYLIFKLLDACVAYKVRIKKISCYDKLRALLYEVNWDGVSSQMNPVKCSTHLIALQLMYTMIHFHMSQEKLSPLNTLKTYNNAELREPIKGKHRLEKNSNVRPLHTVCNIGNYVTE